MPLSPGTRLGSYEITAKLGEGGMGEVWRAKDTRLGREVAIKVLPAAVASDRERLDRFEREARAVSALSDPHIVTLHEVGESAFGPYLVLERIQGDSLRELLRDGALPARRVLALGAQIAEGLAYAHAAGVVHRDLKPENVMVTEGGFAKILDFGLAKLAYPELESSGAMADATTIAERTASGMILGTPGYLSPEQAAGRPADFRSDHFALGALLYEMATGDPPFRRDTKAESLAAVIRDDVEPLQARDPALPAPLGWIVARCLAKDPNDRFASTRDLARDLADLRDHLPELSRRPVDGAPPVEARGGRTRERLAWGAAAAGAIAVLAGGWLALRQPAASVEPATRLTIPPAKPGILEGPPALAPDGRRMAYVLLETGADEKLWIQEFSTGEAREIDGTDGAQEPFWSPDGKFVAFFAHSELRRVAVDGGAPLTLAAAVDPHGGSWGKRGEILFIPSAQSRIYAVAESGGASRPLILEVQPGQATTRYPSFLPDGDHFLYTTLGAAERTGIYWSSLEARSGKRLLPDLSRAVFDPRGYLLFVREGALLAQRFDPSRGELSGEPQVIAEKVGENPQKLGESYFDVSAGGTLAIRATAGRSTELVWMDRSGKRLGVVTAKRGILEPSLSADGSRVLLGVHDRTGNDVWAFDADATDHGSRLTFGAAAISPIWSPDGRRVLFTSPTKSGFRIVTRPTTGTGEEDTLFETPTSAFADDWSRDGRFILFEQYGEKTNVDLWLLPTSGERKPYPYLDSPAIEVHATFSPDGRYVAYVSDETGPPQIYVQTLPVSDRKWQISRSGGDAPTWSADGKELYFVGLDRRLMAVPLRSLSPFAAEEPRPLFRLPIAAVAPTGPRAVYAVAPDRQRVLVNGLVGDPDDPGVHVTLHWTPSTGSR